MISIKVLGPGCANCERVELHAIEAVENLGSEKPENQEPRGLPGLWVARHARAGDQREACLRREDPLDG